MDRPWHLFHRSAERFNKERAFKSSVLECRGEKKKERPQELIKILQACQNRTMQLVEAFKCTGEGS